MSLPLLTEPRGWTALASCATVDPELFFPDKGGSLLDAIAICAGCPVRLQCLDDALAYESQPGVDTYGVWGGLTAEQRKALRGHNRKPVAPCPDCGAPTPMSEWTRQPRQCGLCKHHEDTIRRTA